MKNSKGILAILIILVMIVHITPVGALEASETAGVDSPSDLTYYAMGIDISYWQAPNGNAELVDFQTLKENGCEFVILRIGYGQKLDEAFVEFYNMARKADMPLGVYMYSLAVTRAEAVADAKWAMSIIEEYNMYFEYPIYYDLEEDAQKSLDADEINQICEGWCDTLYDSGYFPGIYAVKSGIMNSLSAAFKAKYDLWIPSVRSDDVEAEQYNPYSIDYNSQGYGMWQYSWSNYNSAEKTYIYDGVYDTDLAQTKRLDLDVCYKDYPTIMRTYGYNNCRNIS